MLLTKIHNIETDEVIEREMTAEEFAAFEDQKAKVEAEELAKAEAQVAKIELLKKLDITEEEAKLLLA